jgi:glucose/arabinose dehydrogenase
MKMHILASTKESTMKQIYSLIVLVAICPLFTLAQAITPVDVELTTFVTGYSAPVGLYNCGDERLFILEKDAGDIKIITTTGTYVGTFLDLTGLISTGGERGLLGMAFHPDYLDNGYFYVNYTNTSGHTVIARYQVSANANVANSSSAQILLTINQPYSNHNGGHIAFGPDGYLYIGMGDGGSAGDPQNYAQNPQNLLGKMLRIDVNQGTTYGIPDSNPFVGDSSTLPEIWAIGLRNPWKFSFDRETGDLYIGDVGQNVWEEINFQSASSTGGENYGWRCYEADVAYNTTGCQGAATYEAPIGAYNHSSPYSFCSITGGVVYRGANYPAMQGIYFFSDYCDGDIYSLTFDGSGWNDTELFSSNAGIVAFGEDATGEVYVVNNSGTIYRLQDTCPFTPEITADLGVLEATSGNQYWWYKDDVLINGANSATFTPTQSGHYYARVNNGTCTRQTNAFDWLVVSGIGGCTYPVATNYNPNAQVDDGSCFFDLNCNCPADFNQNGEIGVSDLLIFMELYGSSCFD